MRSVPGAVAIGSVTVDDVCWKNDNAALFSTPSASEGINRSYYSGNDSLYDPSLVLGVLRRVASPGA